MKLNKLILGAAALCMGGAAFAQVTFSAGVDYTTWGVAQEFRTTDGTESHTDPTAGYDKDGSLTVDVNVLAANAEFNLGLYFNADGGDEEYYDFSDGLHTPFYKGNLKVGFLEDQLNVYLGKFEDWNNGYIADGYVLGAQSIANLADSTYGQYLTGLEFEPDFLGGLRIFAGLPILPMYGNGIPSGLYYNQWKYLYKKFKLAASYKLPLDDLNISVNAGWRPGTYYDGVEAADAAGGVAAYTIGKDDDGNSTGAFTKSAFGEVYLQAELLNLMDMISANISYDLRYRNDATYVNVKNQTVEHNAFAHMIGLSGQASLLDGALGVGLENRFYLATDDYLHSDEKLVYDILAVNCEYALPGTSFSFGADLAGMFGADAMGTAFDGGDVANTNYTFDGDVSMTLNSMAMASTDGLAGKAATYLGAYAAPYFKVNFSTGALKIGAEFALTRFFNSDVENSGFSYRIPVGLSFAF